MTTPLFDRQQNALLGSSVVLDAPLYSMDEATPIPAVDIDSVTFTVMTPTDLPGSPTVNGAAGSVVADGHGQYVVAAGVNAVDGHYRAIATFIYDDNSVTPHLIDLTKSVFVSYEVTDPFQATGASPADPYVDQVWSKLEDCFDSEFGGPWLRDMTLSVFDKYKLRTLIPEVLLAINQQMPFTNYDEKGFPYTTNDGGALFSQGLLVSTLRHLMRSYTEQPDYPGSPVAWADRRRYQQAWSAQYQVELTEFEKWLTRWKLRAYNITHSSLLIGSKSGRMLGGNFRTRGVTRGW